MSYEGYYPNVTRGEISENYLINHERYIPLNDPIYTKKEVLRIIDKKDFQRLKPNSEAWLFARELFDEDIFENGIHEIKENYINEGLDMRIGSSSLADGLGFWTSHAKSFFAGKEDDSGDFDSFTNFWTCQKKTFTDDVNDVKLPWGKSKERNALLYTLEKFNSIKLYECGSYIEPIEGYPMEITITPDALFEDINNGMRGTLEVKCPCPYFSHRTQLKKYTHNPRYPFKYTPYYYVPQKEFQMKSTVRDRGLFGCYTMTEGMNWRLSTLNKGYIALVKEALCWGYDQYYHNPERIPKRGNPFKGYQNYTELLKQNNQISRTHLKEWSMENIGIEPWGPYYNDPIDLSAPKPKKPKAKPKAKDAFGFLIQPKLKFY